MTGGPPQDGDVSDEMTNNGNLLATNASRINEVDDKLAKYEAVFLKMMQDLGKSPSEGGMSSTDDPMVMYEELKKANGGNFSKSGLSTQQLSGLSDESANAHSDVVELRKVVQEVRSNVNYIGYEQLKTERYLKGWNILIHGLSKLPAKRDGIPFDEYEFEFIDFICHELNRLLGDNLYAPIQPQDIERAHKLFQSEESKKAGRSPVVIQGIALLNVGKI